jgi:hypothetical protein
VTLAVSPRIEGYAAPAIAKEGDDMKRVLLVGALISLLTLAAAPSAVSNDALCVGVVTAGSFDNVVVPEGGFCDISNSQIRGNIKALRNSTLFVSGGNTIGGNVEGDKARDVEIFNRGGPPNTIHGNGVIVEDSIETFVCGAILPKGNIILIKNQGGAVGVGGPSCAGFFGGGNTVERGNIKVEDSLNSIQLDVSDNRVGQNVQVFKNRGTATKRVMNNIVGESVQCFDNQAPFVGGPNTAPKREGQCF